MVGLKTISEAKEDKATPLKFLYVSGAATERDQTKRPGWMPEYSLMRVSLPSIPSLPKPRMDLLANVG